MMLMQRHHHCGLTFFAKCILFSMLYDYPFLSVYTFARFFSAVALLDGAGTLSHVSDLFLMCIELWVACLGCRVLLCFHPEGFLPEPEGPLSVLSISLVAAYKILATSLSVNVFISLLKSSPNILVFSLSLTVLGSMRNCSM